MKAVTSGDKERKNNQAHSNKQPLKGQITKSKLTHPSKKLDASNSIPAVHGSRTVYDQGSQLMHEKLQANLAQTGNINHPDTKKVEKDYVATLSINQIRDYHDLKSGTYLPKSLEEQAFAHQMDKKKQEIPATTKLPTTTKLPADKETPKKVDVTSFEQPKPVEKVVKEKKDEVKTPQINTSFSEANQNSSKTSIEENKSANSVQENTHKSVIKDEKESSKNDKQNTKNTEQKEAKIVVPEEIQPVVTPRLNKAVDSEQAEVAPDAPTTLNIVGLVSMAQEFRDQGQEAKAQSKSQNEVAKTLKNKIKEAEKEIQKSDSDLQRAEKSVQTKENLVKHVEKGLATSVKRQQKVEQEVGIYQQEYDKNKTKASDLNSEAKSLLGGSQKHQDSENADSGKLTTKLKELSTNANTIEQAITQSGTTTKKLAQEATQAKAKNESTQKDTIASKKIIASSKTKLAADAKKNIKAKAELQKLKPKLKQAESQSKKLNQEANALLLDSYIIESDLTKTQNAYYTNMETVEGRNSLKQKEKDKIAQTPKEYDEGERLVMAFTQLKTEDEKTAFLRQLDPTQKNLIKDKFEEINANYDADHSEQEGLINQNVESIREAQIEGFNKKRKDALQKPLNLATKNLNRITGLKRLWMSISIAFSGIWNDITSVTWTDVGKFIEAIFSPKAWVKGIGDSISGIWEDLSNWEGFSKDPVGMILQKAAGIANKVLAIAGIITGILGILTLGAIALSILSLGFAAPAAVWLGSATITMGTITFWIGAIALGLNVLNGIKNIYDVHTAKTAEVLIKNSGELKSDITNSGMAILAMIGGKASKKGGASVRDLAKKHPQTFGKRIFITLKNGIKAKIVAIPKKIASVFKKETWVKSFQSFKAAYNKAKSWTNEYFDKKKKPQNRTFDQSPFEEQTVPDRMRDQPLQVRDNGVNIDKRIEQLRNAGLQIVEKENTISIFNKHNVLVAEIKDGVLRFKYSGYGGDIIMNSERTTTVLGKFAEEWLDPKSGGTRNFLGSKGDPIVEGLPEGSFSRGEGVLVDKGGMSFLDIAEDKYNALLNKHIKKYLDQGLDEINAKKLGITDGNNEFWERYNYPFLEDAFKRGDDIRLVSDPLTFKESGTYARELDAINSDNGLAKKYGYIYDEKTKTYSKK